MFDSKIYNDGDLIVGKMSGVIEPQSFINGIFWQIDCRNVGEVKKDFSQLYYDDDIESVVITEKDITRIAEINTGIGVNVGRFRTALVLRHPELFGWPNFTRCWRKNTVTRLRYSISLKRVSPGWNMTTLTLTSSNCKNGAPDWNRTSDLWLRRPTLYPAELRAHFNVG